MSTPTRTHDALKHLEPTMVTGKPVRAGATAPSHPLRAWLVGDFAASRNGNHSVAEDMALRLSQKGVVVGVTSRSASRAIRAADMMMSTWRHRRSIDVAVVDVYSGRAFAWAEAVCAVLRGSGVPYVLVLRGGNLPGFAQRQRHRVMRLLNSAVAIVALSRYLMDEMVLPRDTLHLLPNPIDVSAYPFVRRTAVSPRLVWLRSFHEMYNPEMALRVLARLSAEFADATLVMVGPDKGDGTLDRTRRLSDELGLQARVEFVGPVPKRDVPTQLGRGDVFLNTPRVDNVPISLLEAMACGACVVSTNVGGIPYLAEDGRAALLVPSDDDEAMAAAVARVFRDPDLASTLSIGGRRIAEEHDWESIFPRWEALLNEVALIGRDPAMPFASP